MAALPTTTPGPSTVDHSRLTTILTITTYIILAFDVSVLILYILYFILLVRYQRAYERYERDYDIPLEDTHSRAPTSPDSPIASALESVFEGIDRLFFPSRRRASADRSWSPPPPPYETCPAYEDRVTTTVGEDSDEHGDGEMDRRGGMRDV